MGSNILAEVADGGLAKASQLNQYFTALVQDIVARNASGEPEDSAGAMGSDVLEFTDLFLSGSIFVNGNQGGYCPSGTLFPYTASTTEAPSGYIFANGDTIGNEASGAAHTGEIYRYLYDKYKLITSYGNTGSEDFDLGDTVLIPNLDGRFVRSTGAQNPDSSGIGDTQESQNDSHTHVLSSYNSTSTNFGGIATATSAFTNNEAISSSAEWANATSLYNVATEGGNEARPAAISFPYIIKV